MVALTRIYHFSAAHRLAQPTLGPEDNARLYGPCARAHGHNYLLEVTVAGSVDPVTGTVADVDRLDALVRDEILAHVDHRTLEEVPFLAGQVTTGEALARACWARLARALPPGRLRRVAVVETANNRFEYGGTPA